MMNINSWESIPGLCIAFQQYLKIVNFQANHKTVCSCSARSSKWSSAFSHNKESHSVCVRVAVALWIPLSSDPNQTINLHKSEISKVPSLTIQPHRFYLTLTHNLFMNCDRSISKLFCKTNRCHILCIYQPQTDQDTFKNYVGLAATCIFI